MTTIESVLAEIKERAEKATAGPWQPYSPNSVETIGAITVGKNLNTWGNALFVAHSRTDVPKLVAALERALKSLGNIDFAYPKDGSYVEKYGGAQAREALTDIHAILTGEK